MKNHKVKAARIDNAPSVIDTEGPDFFEGDAKPKIIALQSEPKKIFSKISDDVAQSDHWMKNEPIPFGLDLFPQDFWFMRYSDLFYPNAKGGPLYIDTPTSMIQVRYCERKLEAYRTKRVRYTYIKHDEDASDALMRLDPVLPMGGKT